MINKPGVEECWTTTKTANPYNDDGDDDDYITFASVP